MGCTKTLVSNACRKIDLPCRVTIPLANPRLPPHSGRNGPQGGNMREYRDRQRSLEQLAAHLTVWAEELSAWELSRHQGLGHWTLTPPDGPAQDFAVGQDWPHRHGLHRFASGMISPDGLAGPLELRLDFGGEALVRLFSAAGSQLDAFGANPYHKRFTPPTEPFRIEADVAARSLFGIPNRSPRFALAELARVQPEIRALRRRLEVIVQTVGVVEPDLGRALCELAEIALSKLRLPTATDTVGPRMADQPWARAIWERSFEPTDTPAELDDAALASVVAATDRLDQGLSDLRDRHPKIGKVLATGHAHIDYVWLWPQPETVRKIVRTFNSANGLLKSHPDFTFLQSSSLYYKHVEQEDPALFAEIKQRVAEGRWEVTGGMFIECDTNMPSAEAFIRQFLFGQRYFEKHFGSICRTAWLPDTFGFTGAMPQIMAICGIETLVTIKVSWNETNRLPENLFRWQGNDGSRVLVHTFDAYQNDGYNMLMRPQALVEVWKNHLGKDLTDTVIASYGWGDGGGGPDPDQIESLPILNLMPALPSVAHGSIQRHLDRISADLAGAAVPVWTGEMYLEYHRATLTSQARVKQLNRRAERALVAAEAMAGLSILAGLGGEYPDLADDWELMLRNQFHDILPGSSIREAYEQTEPELAGIVARCETLAASALARMAGEGHALAVANLSGSAKPHWQVLSKEPLPAALAPQKVDGGYAVACDHPLAPLSIGFATASSAKNVIVNDRSLENELVFVLLDDHGRVASMIDKRTGRDVIDGAANRLMLYRNDLPRKYDAWDIEPGFDLSGEELLDLDSIQITATGPHLGEITVTRRFGSSRIIQHLRLWSNSARLEFATEVDWHDRRCYLRATFPLNILAEQAVFDQAIGVTQRATHDNTTWQQAQFEGSGHRFASLAETEFGAALLSADKYGFSAKGNTLTLSLLRGPMYPDMLADEGRHEFTYALLPHDGRWWSAEVAAEADLFCDPLRHAAAAPRAAIAPLGWHGPDMRFHALKPAEAGSGHILRLSEAAGRRGILSIATPAGATLTRVDGLERPIADGNQITPFRVVSVKIAGD